jgi:polysaccharide export outer membrane protein
MRLVLAFGFLLSLAVSPALAAQATTAGDPSSFSLLPGDALKIQIWREEDLSGEFVVDERGRITLPLLGEREVTGQPLARLRDDLVEAYRVYLENPSISVVPLRRVSVLGEVGAPGLYPIDPTISLAQLLAVAGGIRPEGNWDRVRIVREGQVFRERIVISETVQSAGIRSGDQVIVDRRSWVVRNGMYMMTFVISTVALFARAF